MVMSCALIIIIWKQRLTFLSHAFYILFLINADSFDNIGVLTKLLRWQILRPTKTLSSTVMGLG